MTNPFIEPQDIQVTVGDYTVPNVRSAKAEMSRELEDLPAFVMGQVLYTITIEYELFKDSINFDFHNCTGAKVTLQFMSQKQTYSTCEVHRASMEYDGDRVFIKLVLLSNRRTG